MVYKCTARPIPALSHFSPLCQPVHLRHSSKSLSSSLSDQDLHSLLKLKKKKIIVLTANTISSPSQSPCLTFLSACLAGCPHDTVMRISQLCIPHDRDILGPKTFLRPLVIKDFTLKMLNMEISSMFCQNCFVFSKRSWPI